MNQFSTSQEAGGYCAICDQGNLFYLGNPSNMSCPAIRGSVNGLSTPALPMCTVETLQNTAPGTSGQLCLNVAGKEHVLIEDLASFGTVTVPEQLQVNVGIAPVPTPAPTTPPPWSGPTEQEMARARGEGGPMVPIGQYSSARMPGQYGVISPGHEMNALDVMSELNAHNYPPYNPQGEEHPVTILEVDAELGPPPGGEGMKDVDSLTDAEAEWLGHVISGYTKTVAGVGLRAYLTFGPAEHRAFLKEVGLRRMKFWRLSNGTLMIAFKGNNRLRSMITASTYGMAALNGKNITLLDTAFRSPVGNSGAGAARFAKAGGWIGVVIVSVIDTTTYFANPDESKELTDLLVDLGLNIPIAMLSTIAGTIATGFAIGIAGTIGAPVILAVAAGFFVGIVVGLIVSGLVEATGMRASMKEALRNSEAPKDELYQSMMTAP